MGSGRAEIASQMRRRRLAALMIALAVAPLFATVTQAKAAAAPSAGSLSYAYATSNGTAHYRVFTPSSYRAGTAVPLVVVIHGCGLSASDEEAATLYDRVAQRFGFVVAYPDNDFGSHPGGCWQFYNKSATSGDIPVIVGMTRAVMRIRSIDRTRVYAIGTSSGGLLTSDLAAYNPRLYAAIGLMAGGPFGPDLCLTSQVSPLSVLSSASSEAAAAFRAEGAKRRVIPFIVLNGDADHVVSPQCGADAVQQWVRADNLSRSGGQDSPYRLSPIITQHRLPAVPGGYPYEVSTYGTAKCIVGQHYVIHGMGHGWSGGTTNPKYASSTNPLVAASRPLGPSAAMASWMFFSRFSLRDVPACVHR